MLTASAPSAPATAPADAGIRTPRAMYSSWVNGPWQNANFFPISVFWQAPMRDAAAGVYEKINIFQGISGMTGAGIWPEKFGADSGELEAIKLNNLYLIGGVN